ncbi:MULTISPECIES: hypothetical protein [Streptomyces violaceusniger group]|uniref:Secreted protein n=2 Tax=Streptomyces javensis TaxID=114698 RepID=A0ABS0RAC7_9ACTN|nr:hypothetical protein [Streptomyces javensis]MBI0313816.1 hypothetical protein [Streptomyces javensis]
MVRMTRRGALVGVVAAVLAVAGLGAYLLWPAPTLDAADMDAVVPTKRDLPGFVPHDGLTGALSVPSGNKAGRSVLTGGDLDEQCRKWRKEGDGWACRHLRGAGMVVLERSENVFFRVKSDVLAYDDPDAAEAAWDGLVADNRQEIHKVRGAKERSSDLGDAALSFEAPGVTVLAIRVETVVVEAIVWDGSDQVSEADEDAMVEKWPALQLSKIEKRLG